MQPKFYRDLLLLINKLIYILLTKINIAEFFHPDNFGNRVINRDYKCSVFMLKQKMDDSKKY